MRWCFLLILLFAGCDCPGDIPMPIMTLRPAGLGSNDELIAQSGTTYGSVSDDTDDTLVSTSSQATGTDTYTLDTFTPAWEPIEMVRVILRADRPSELVATTIRSALWVDGALYLGAVQAVGDDITNYTQDWLLNPATGLAWTWADITALEAGVQIADPLAGDTGAWVYEITIEVHIVETSWKVSTDTAFGFFGDADDALADWLQNNSAHTTYFGNTVNTWQAGSSDIDRAPTYDFSKSKFPIVLVRSGHAGYSTDYVETGAATLVRVRTELMVFTESSDMATGSAQCKEIAGALASAIHQTRNGSEAGEWATFYCNWSDPQVTAEPLQYVAVGEGAPHLRMRSVVDWAHHDD